MLLRPKAERKPTDWSGLGALGGELAQEKVSLGLGWESVHSSAAVSRSVVGPENLLGF